MPSQKNPDEGFSEFSYGFALTRELVTMGNPPLLTAPIFPSLVEEGKSGGFDVKMDWPGQPLFVQFKLSQRIVGKRAIEFKEGEFGTAFYRMAIRSRARSRQHEMLLELEQDNQGGVFYYTPAFHIAKDLNSHYASRSVEANSRRVKPSEIPLPQDNRNHWLSFQRAKDGSAHRHSEESTQVELDHRPLEIVLQDLRKRPESLGHALERSRNWFRQRNLFREDLFAVEMHRKPSMSLLDLAVSAQLAFGCTMFVLQEREA
jgi:hypothetical protein